MAGATGRVRGWLGSHLKLVLVSAITALAVSAALAVATVPDGSGVIHTCYELAPAGGGLPASGPNLRVIDSDGGQSCDAASERALNFSQQGPVGPAGAAGAPGAAGSPSTGDDCPAVVGHLKLSASLQSDLCGIAQVKVGSKSAGGPSGPGAATEFELTRRVDSLSPKLLNAAVQGTLFNSAAIQVYKPGTTSVAKTFSLARAAISSVKIGQGQVKPTESLTLISVPKKGT